MSVIREIRHEVVLKGRQNNQCWFAPGIAVVPPRAGNTNVEVHVSASQLTGNDCGAQHWIRTGNLGEWWTPPMESLNLTAIPRENHFFEKPTVAPFYHRASDRLIGFGSTQFLRDAGGDTMFKRESHDWKKECKRRNTMVSTQWNFTRGDFEPWRPVAAPPELERFHRHAWPRLQHELSDGSVLASVYVIEREGDPYYGAAAMRMEIQPDGGLRVLEMGNILRRDTKRGLCEPSITRFGERYFMTIRHDDTAYVAVGKNGLHYAEPVLWRFDDGTELGNYNTQQHWLVQDDALYLVYNRRHELNNGVFRSRAPLFIAQVDPDNLCILRDTERIVFPEKRARMGNFGVVKVTDKEAWVVTGEWIQGRFPDITPEHRFYVEGGGINCMQYIGDLLLARIVFD